MSYLCKEDVKYDYRTLKYFHFYVVVYSLYVEN